jgi:hypothetical protein
MPKSATELLTVAALDIKMVDVAGLLETMVVPGGMPVPVRVALFTTLARLDAPVIVVLPAVTRPLNVPVLLALAVFDITTVKLGALPLVERMVAPDWMPVPEMARLVDNPLRLATPVMFALPVVTWPVNVPLLLPFAFNDSVIVLLLMVRGSAVLLVAVAAFDITMVVPLIETMVVPAGMPVPEMESPTATLVRFDTPVMFTLPEVVKPVGVTEVEAVDTMVVPEAMPVPEMGCPGVSPAMLDTFEMVKLPVETTPVIVLEPVPRTVVLAAMPAPVMGCPTRSPAVPAAYAPVNVTVGLPAVTLPVMAAIWLEAVAGFDMVMVLPLVVELTAVMLVLGGMPPTPLGTAMVRVSTILVVRATGAGLLTVAAFEITMVEVLALDETMVVPDGMPAPEMGWPVVTPTRLDNPVMVVLPAVR